MKVTRVCPPWFIFTTLSISLVINTIFFNRIRLESASYSILHRDYKRDTNFLIKNDSSFRPVIVKDLPDVNEDRPTIVEDRQGVHEDRPTVVEDRPGVHEDRSTVEEDRQGVEENRPTIINDRPGSEGDRPFVGNDRPGVDEDRQATVKDHPGVDEDRPVAVKNRTGIEENRPTLVNDRPGLNEDRPVIVKDRLEDIEDRPAVDKDPPGVDVIRPAIAGEKSDFGINLSSAVENRPAVLKNHREGQVVVKDSLPVANDRSAVELNHSTTVIELTESTKLESLVKATHRQKVRKDVLRKACSDFKLKPSRKGNLSPKALASFEHTMLFDKHRLMYCYVPKAGCTSFKQVFLSSHGITLRRNVSIHKTFEATFKNLSQTKPALANRKIKEYNYFVFVRNPFTRLLSAFREKIENRNPENRTDCPLCHLIIWFLRDDDPLLLDRKNSSEPYTFEEFVRYTIATKKPNEHWMNQFQLCHPCQVDFDFIGKYETMHEDVEDFLISKTSDSLLKFPESDPSKPRTRSSNDENMVKYYSSLPDDVFVNLVHSLYRDLRVFGYSIPEVIRRPNLRLPETVETG
ncbi:carbohydrate sulfotransferase 12-like [Lytechinus variegatus]|uniref:carbohydrate sulfotransferase 12-like n=1 Tax=Lytechinus variegatus TaxID=7654 RepID=UPI001BB2AD26|nr:carbohydrate sulfotransferase 12-like [Lytechinus variegatus]